MMVNILLIYDYYMVIIWENHGKIMGKSWENGIMIVNVG